MKLSDNAWSMIGNHLGYSEEELAKFREDPRNEEVMAKAPELMRKTITATIVESKGCNSQHKVGDTIYFDGAGNLLTKLSPKRICVYALHSVVPHIFATNELFYAGVDPDKLLFRKVGCSDVGLECGGWGHIVMEIRVRDREAVIKELK